MKKIIILSLASSLFLISCGGNTPKSTTETAQAAPVQTYEFTVNAIGNTMADMSYDTKELKVKSGAKVKINLNNTGTDAAMLHNIVIVKTGTEKEVAMEGLNLKEQNYVNTSNANVIAASALTQPGASTVLEFTVPEAGTYTYICTYPGHWQKMQGVLIVE